MILAELRQRVQERCSGYPSADVDAALNEGCRLFSLLTLCAERVATLPLQADQPLRRILQTVPDFIAPLRVQCVRRQLISGSTWDLPPWDMGLFDDAPIFTESSTPVRPATLRDLAALNPSWRLDRDGIVRQYGIQGLDVLFLHPCPSDTATALRITYAGQAQEMTGDGSEPEMPEEYQPALISYALCTLPLKFGGVELAQFAPEWGKYLGAVQECAEWFRNRARAQQYDTMPAQLVLADKSAQKRGKQ